MRLAILPVLTINIVSYGEGLGELLAEGEVEGLLDGDSLDELT